MSALTSIEWTDRTWNPIRGCSRVSEGCRNCYAERMAARFSKPGGPFHGYATSSTETITGRLFPGTNEAERRVVRGPRWTGKVELVPKLLREPLRWRKPQKVFVNSMSDLFHESLPDQAIDQVFAVMVRSPQHTFQILTKRPERMRAWFAPIGGVSRRDFVMMAEARSRDSSRGSGAAWPLQNVWLGVSVEDQQTADERIPLLLQTPGAVRFVSYEPALGPVDFRYLAPFDDFHTDALDTPDPTRRLDWVIVGGESGPGARPFDIAWARSVVEQCKAAGVACFVKQLGSAPEQWPEEFHETSDCGSPIKLRDRKGGDTSEWPDDLRVRQFPDPARQEKSA